MFKEYCAYTYNFWVVFVPQPVLMVLYCVCCVQLYLYCMQLLTLVWKNGYCQLPELNYKSNQSYYCYIPSEYFSVTDPPSILDPTSSDVAEFLSVLLHDDQDFHRFGAQLLSAKPLEVTIIKQKKVELQEKCLRLIELWIKSVKGPKWQHLVEAASKSNLEGLATALTEELQLNGQKELQESVDETKGGKYKIASKINLCVY